MEAGRRLTKDQEDYLEPVARKVAEAFAEFKEKLSELGLGATTSNRSYFAARVADVRTTSLRRPVPT